MNIFSFLTIDEPAEGAYKAVGSIVLAFAYPVTQASESEIKQKVDALEKKYFDATHHCFAWILGADKSRFRTVDDGEPNHSAGDPILGQIRSKNLTNVLVVVVRYYGGTKLGVGGLIQAYKASAEAALNNDNYSLNKDAKANQENCHSPTIP
ncbi:MAG: YigZ family protein [Cytophagales bacterium]|nr:YigZ family protein [Cytophagales bacterium]